VIFDLDGTLYPTESSFLPVMHRVYAEFGLPIPPDSEILALVGDTYDNVLKRLIAQGFETTLPVLKEMISRYEFEFLREGGSLYEGVDATLLALRQRGFRTAICTNGDRPYVHAVLGESRMTQLFDAISTHGDAGETKTSMIASLIKRFEPRYTVVVGDRSHDVEAGRNNGCTVVGAAYGFGGEEELEQADVLITAFDQLLDVIGEMTPVP